MPQHERRARLEAPRRDARSRASAARLPLRLSPASWRRTLGAARGVRASARALGAEGLMLKAREAPTASGAAQGRRPRMSGGSGRSTR